MWISFSFYLLQAPVKGWSSPKWSVRSRIKPRRNSILCACPQSVLGSACMKGNTEQERDMPRRHSEAWHYYGLQDRLRSSFQLNNPCEGDCITWQTFFQSEKVKQLVLQTSWSAFSGAGLCSCSLYKRVKSKVSPTAFHSLAMPQASGCLCVP